MEQLNKEMNRKESGKLVGEGDRAQVGMKPAQEKEEASTFDVEGLFWVLSVHGDSPQEGHLFPSVASLGMSDVSIWKNPKKHRLIEMDTLGNVGTSLGKQPTGPLSFWRILFPSLAPFRENSSPRKWKVTASGSQRESLFRIEKRETLSAEYLENLWPGDPSSFTIAWNYQ